LRPLLALSNLVIREIFRKKDFYVAFLLIFVILFYVAQFQFYNVGNTVRYLIELGLLLIYFFSVVLTATLAARQYPSEVQNRTCHTLLAKPVSRISFITGKFLGSFAAGAACFSIFYAVFITVAWHKAGGGLSVLVAAQAFYLFLLNLFVFSAMVSGLSYYFTVGANVTSSIIVYLLINTYGPGLRDETAHLFWPARYLGEFVYYFLPHFEFFDLRQRFIHGWEALSPALAALLTLYAFLYAFLFLFLGWLKMRRQFL